MKNIIKMLVIATISFSAYAETFDLEDLIESASSLTYVTKNQNNWPYYRNSFKDSKFSAVLSALLSTSRTSYTDDLRIPGSFTSKTSLKEEDSVDVEEPSDTDRPFSTSEIPYTLTITTRTEATGGVPVQIFKTLLKYTMISKAKKPSELNENDIIISRYKNSDYEGKWVHVKFFKTKVIEIEVVKL